ncbi:MAG: restriction endonuclease [bacterium]|nr:restriction endonuclease [bacterium]
MFTQDQLFLMAWRIFAPFLLLIAIVVLAAYVYYLLKRRRLAAAGMLEIDRMSGKDFETKMALVFKARGYRVEQTPYVGDWGADLVVSRGGERTVAQIKRWNRKVGVRAIQEVVAAKAKYGCQQALVATNSFYTEAAVDLARINRVELWDRDRLVRELLELNRGERESHRQTSSPPDGPPRCYKCGREMVLKENARGKFWACPGFPKCRNTFPARA